MAQTVRARIHDGRLEPLEAIDLPEGEEVVVTVSPAAPRRNGDGLRSSFGAWRGVDAEELLRQIYEARQVSTRPEPRL